MPQTKTVLFTLYENTLSRRLASASGVSAVLSKTEGLIALSKAVRTLLADKLREAEETLGRASRERRVDPKDLEALSQQLNAPLTRCSRDLKYLWANQHYADWLQRPVDEIVGRPIVDVLGKSAFQVLERHFEQALRGTGVVYDEAADFEKIGRRHVLAAYKPTIRPDGSVDGWVAYVEDRTENTSENRTEHAGTMQLAPEPSEPAAPNSVNAN